MDFSEIVTAAHDQRIRAWALEKALTATAAYHADDIVSFAKVFEDYVKDGEIAGAIRAAVEEGNTEGRFEVKQAVEEWFSNVDLDDLFKAKGWITQKGVPENDA